MSAFSFASLLAAFSFSELWEGRVLPWWERFAQVFVGEDLMIQCGAAAGALVIAYLVSLGLTPLFKKVEVAIEQRDDWVEEIVDWVSANLFRVLFAGLLWSASMYFDGRNLELAGLEAEGAPAAETVVAEGAAPEVVEAAESGAEQEGAEATGEASESVASVEALAAKNYILLRAFASIATLWLVSGALPARIKQQAYYKILFFVLAVGLMLNLLGIWTPIRDGLNAIKLLPVTDSQETLVTALTLLKGIIAILILIPLAGWLMRSTEKKVRRMQRVSPALQVLTVKLVKSLVVAGGVLFAVSSVGINLSAFAFMGGAIGLGLGFGFQKVVSNLISGVILLGDKSIKPGDVIQVDDTYGWINKLGARYTSVITRDGTEHLIPNEMMITEKVVNWSFSDDKVRLKVPFGVSYNSDVRKVMELAKQVALEHPRILKEPVAVVRMMGFGDSSVDFELRVWLTDPQDGVNNIRSDLYLGLWDQFQEHGIEIPFPQRDLHIRDARAIPVVVKEGRETTDGRG